MMSFFGLKKFLNGNGWSYNFGKNRKYIISKTDRSFFQNYIKIHPKNVRKDRENIFTLISINVQAIFFASPQHFLYFFPLPHGHGSLRPTEG